MFKFVVALALMFSAVSRADRNPSLGVGCGNEAARAATAALDSKMPTWGNWYIQEFKTIVPANDFEFIMQANGGLVDDDSSRAYLCAKVTVDGYMGATDCKIIDVKVEKSNSVETGLCK
jgi:hypothetical protein